MDIELDIIKEKLTLEVRYTFRAYNEARKSLVDVVEEAHKSGIGYREMAAATGMSHEYFRLLLIKDGRLTA